MMVTGGLNDRRVGFWDPAKWVAKLRAYKTDDRLLLLQLDMAGGHLSAASSGSGLAAAAAKYAFLLATLPTCGGPSEGSAIGGAHSGGVQRLLLLVLAVVMLAAAAGGVASVLWHNRRLLLGAEGVARPARGAAAPLQLEAQALLPSSIGELSRSRSGSCASPSGGGSARPPPLVLNSSGGSGNAATPRLSSGAMRLNTPRTGAPSGGGGGGGRHTAHTALERRSSAGGMEF